MRTETDSWFPYRSDARGVGAGAPQLMCIPHAGSGAGVYRGWQHRLGSAVQVLPVQLPGREYRLGEPPLTAAAEVVAALTGPALDVLRPPYALFGHSMGALLAFELAHALTACGRPPAHLVVSGFGAPQLDPAQRLAASGAARAAASDEVLVEHLRAMDGTTADVLAEPELVELVLGVLRADYALCEGYRFHERAPLHVPLTVLSGRDDPTVPERHLTAWRDVTTAPTRHVRFPGGHFYLDEHLDDVLALLTACAGA